MREARGVWKVGLLIPLSGFGLVMLMIAGWGVAKTVAPEKSCDLYRSFIHGVAAPGFIPSDDCSWVARSPIGHFTVNGVPFTIPRDYLWQGASKADGPVDGLYIMMRYPEMEPAPPFPYHDLNVRVSVWPTSDNIHCAKFNKCEEISRMNYLYQSGIDECELYPWNCVKDKMIPNKIQEIADGMRRYTSHGGKDIYFSGELLSPDFWFVCSPQPQSDQKNIYPLCEAWVQVNDKIFLNVAFRRVVLVQHIREVHEGIIRKINAFLTSDMAASALGFDLEN